MRTLVAFGFAVYAGQIAGIGSGSGAGYPLSASFRSAQGVNVGTDVRLALGRLDQAARDDANTVPAILECVERVLLADRPGEQRGEAAQRAVVALAGRVEDG